MTVVGLAMRIGYRMGLHRTGSDPQIPFFEQEMRVRVWWQIRSRARRFLVGLSPWDEFRGNTLRLPLECE